jgi:hypothetical protein
MALNLVKLNIHDKNLDFDFAKPIYDISIFVIIL